MVSPRRFTSASRSGASSWIFLRSASEMICRRLTAEELALLDHRRGAEGKVAERGAGHGVVVHVPEREVDLVVQRVHDLAGLEAPGCLDHAEVFLAYAPQERRDVAGGSP
jgi:hypothetical protein